MVLKEENISYNHSHFQSEVSIVMLDIEDSCQIVRLGVSYSHFLIELTLLHCIGESVTKSFKHLGKGAFSRVHKYEGDKVVAIKSVYVGDGSVSENLERSLRKLVIEYSMSKLFSCLKVGPKVCKTFGFDLIPL